jgi:hypothetical protein
MGRLGWMLCVLAASTNIEYGTGFRGSLAAIVMGLSPGHAASSTPTAVPSPGDGPCNLNATPSSFASQVSAASAGQVICLASGNYGTWNGVKKAVVIKAATDATPNMRVNFNSSVGGFVLDGMNGMGGKSVNAKNFTIRNSVFSDTIDIEVTDGDILLDRNTHDWHAVYAKGSYNAKVRVQNDTAAFSGVTVQNSTFRNGDLDGIHLGAGINILNNIFDNLCDVGTNHTDNIQFEGGTGGRIAGNYVYASLSCETQGIASFDGGTVGVIIEDNVIDISRKYGIEFYADKNSIIRHNTVLYRASGCAGGECGYIDINRKPANPAGVGTQVYDNIAIVSFGNGSTGISTNNMFYKAATGSNFTGRPVYVGGASPTSYAGFKLAPRSPGKGRASDGTDVGARIP